MLTNKKVNIFYILHCLFDFYTGITGAIFVLLLYSYHLNEMEVNFVIGLPLLLTFMMEIPTGVFSDYIGYKKSILLSGFLLIIANVLFILGNNLYWFSLAQIIIGLSTTFITGTLDAWIVSTLNDSNHNHLFVKKNKYSTIIAIVAGFISGIIADKNIKLIFVFALIASLLFEWIAFKYIDALNIYHVQSKSMTDHFIDMKNIFKESLHYSIQNKALLRMFVFYGLFTFCTASVFVYWSPVMYSFENINYFLIGFSWSLMRIFMLVGNILADKIKDINLKTLMILTFCCGLVILTMTITNQFYLFFMMLMLFELLLGLIFPMRETLLNNIIDYSNRATLLSFNSMIVSILNYISIIFMGMISEFYSISISWFLSGSIMILLAIFCVKKETM